MNTVFAAEPTATPIPTETPIPMPTIDIPSTVEIASTQVPTDASEVATAEPNPVTNPEALVEEAAVPEDVEADPADDREEVTPYDGSSEDEDPVTEEANAATVSAMRAAVDEKADANGEEDASIEPEPALTVLVCNEPPGGDEAVGAVTAGVDYLLAAAGLFGLIVARVCLKRQKNAD